MVDNKKEINLSSKLIKAILLNLIYSILIVFFIELVFLKEQTHYDWNYQLTAHTKIYYAVSVFGNEIWENYSRFDYALHFLLKDDDIKTIIILWIIFTCITIVNHFVKFKIK